MAKREFMMLAHPYEPGKHHVAAWYMSEKMDGERCFWDGGITRGMNALEIPFANTDKDGRLAIQPVSTGLWTRNAKVIHAPAWWLDRLPPVPLDCELWMGCGKFQDLSRTVRTINRTQEIDELWRSVQMVAIDSPSFEQIFAPGTIDTAFYKKNLEGMNTLDWINRHAEKFDVAPLKVINAMGWRTYNFVYPSMLNMLADFECSTFAVIKQTKLPDDLPGSLKLIEESIDRVLLKGGEGLILRRPGSNWKPERTDSMLKVKKHYDAEATVVGYMWGKKRLKGKLGALIVKWNPMGDRWIEFELSGFTDDERRMVMKETKNPADNLGGMYEGLKVGPSVVSAHFPIGSSVSFKYREMTNDGKPKEGVYLRKAANG